MMSLTLMLATIKMATRMMNILATTSMLMIDTIPIMTI